MTLPLHKFNKVALTSPRLPHTVWRRFFSSFIICYLSLVQLVRPFAVWFFTFPVRFFLLSSTGANANQPQSVSSTAKKNSSRRNAWGNLSYADLITQAISSAGDNRLTLSQIYEWMVQNVPYFKDKGDSNSSAGWKVSVIDF